MQQHQMPENAVVVGYDGSSTSEVALELAIAEASSAGTALHIMHTIAYPDGLLGPSDLDIDPDRDEVTQQGRERALREAPELEVSTQTSAGGAAAWLVELSSRARLVVVGGRDRSVTRAVVVGATAPQVAAHSRCPVIVVHPDGGEPVPPSAYGSDAADAGDTDKAAHAARRVVVGVDGSESGTGAVEFAFDRASRLGLGLTALACWWWQQSGPYLAGTEDFGWENSIVSRQERLVSEQLAGWSQRYPDVDVKTDVVHGNPVEVLVAAAAGAGAEMLVLGTRGRGGFSGLLLGSVSLRVLTAARRPIAIVPPAAS